MPSRSRRVLVTGPVPPPMTGASRVTEHMVDQLRARDCDVVVADTNSIVVGSRWRGQVRRLSQMTLALLRIVGRRVDAVYVGGAGGELLWYQALVVLLARISGRLTVFHHHNYFYVRTSTRVMRAITRAGGARLVHVALCPGMGEGLARRYAHVRQVRVVSNAAYLEPALAPAVAAQGGRPGARVVIGHLSNLTVAKGCPTVLEAARRARAEGLDVVLLLGGPPGDEESERLVRQAQAELGAALDYWGPVSDVDEFYRRIDLFLFPTRYANEAEPLVVWEAARHGVPSLVHDTGCLGGMVAPDLLVALDDDFVGPALDRIRRLATVATDGTAVRAGFDERRTTARTALADLVGELAGER